ncbi:ABC transporter ATP-binding protein [Shewanella corallii]|uniref:ABC transporter ATP-binding protein n=1 Tax=Shewanella corallii TaxID=560080 RepID=A0ABT0NDE1_9GAMM|nr:ABC transporter ATP-binding protein [Shewanella corallii]MCL2916497.1 ABC transporter ATP-binding protein [Shewanella corallii]
MTEPDTPLLSFNKITKRYGDKPALDDFSLELLPGMVVGLLGHNGAGKSTLMRAAMGILDIELGELKTLGESPAELSSSAKSRIGYVPQQPVGYEGFTVAQALSLHSSFYSDWDKELESQWLVRFGLDSKARVQQLSIGQRQSLALIMAMAYRPKLLLLDEPVASLDPISRQAFMSDLFELALESGSGVLFSTHITSDLERVASHVALIRQGKLVLMRELDLLREQIRLLHFSEGAERHQLPEGLTVLAQNRYSILVDGYQGQAISDAQIETVNLERLYMEMNRGEMNL